MVHYQRQIRNQESVIPQQTIENNINKQDQEEDEENEDNEENQMRCMKNYSGISTISSKLQCRTFVLYAIVSIIILISRIFYIENASQELDNYGLNYEIKYRLIDFQQMTKTFFSNFEKQINQSKHALDTINDIYNIAEIRSADYSFDEKAFIRCHIQNVTYCISKKKSEEIAFKARTDAFYKVYYFFTSSIYVTSGNESDDTTITKPQNDIISKTSIFEKFYFNLFSHFYFTQNLHHKMFIVFPELQVARIYPVFYHSDSPTDSLDYTTIKYALNGDNKYWKTDNNKKYEYFMNIQDNIQTKEVILRISRKIFSEQENKNVGVVSLDIFERHLNTTFSNLLGSNYNTYFIDAQGYIIQTNIENFNEPSIFTVLQGCYCENVLWKLKQLGQQPSTSITCKQPITPYSDLDCEYFNMKELWLNDGKYTFFLITTRDNNYKIQNSDRLIFTIIYVYISLFICLFIAIIYITRKTIQDYTTDITNPLRQISFKIQRIMHNIFNPKQFSKIRTDEIVIREKTEIRKLANKFGETFQRLNDKNLFQTTIVSSIDKSYQKSKEISDKPQKDTIVDEVRNIVQSFIDDQLNGQINEQAQQERNKYARSNKSRNNLDGSILRE